MCRGIEPVVKSFMQRLRRYVALDYEDRFRHPSQGGRPSPRHFRTARSFLAMAVADWMVLAHCKRVFRRAARGRQAFAAFLRRSFALQSPLP